MKTPLHPKLEKDLIAKGVDLARTYEIIELTKKPHEAAPALRIPDAADSRIIDRRTPAGFSVPKEGARSRLEALGLGEAAAWAEESGGMLRFGEDALERIGTLLYPKTAYGVLNGGSATSYFDEKKNRELDHRAYDLFKPEFEAAAAAGRWAPKGATPAYLAADGTKGPSFLELKMRSLLLRAAEYRRLTGDAKTPLLPFFQMTSGGTDAKLAEAYERYRSSPLLAPLIAETGVDPTRPLGAVQPLLAALTHSADGLPRKVFAHAYGKDHVGIALPGGHGENYRVLAGVYRSLRAAGIRYAYLGNVDNSGYTIDPASLAVLALSGSSGAFEFSWKTAVDVKGGILVETDGGKLTVADIGQSIHKKDVAKAEAAGKPVLFNCATGLFDLDWLVPRLAQLADALPVRVSDQDKEAGRYAQAEQNTWDLVGLMDAPLIFAVAKEKRFIAAKMFLETLLASPAGKRVDADPAVGAELKAASRMLRDGLGALLEGEFGL